MLVAGLVATALGAFLFLRTAGDSLVRNVPDDTVLYATVYVDPPAGQKLNLNTLISKFPAAGDPAKRNQSVDKWLDQVTYGFGMTHKDITDFVGSQVAISIGAEAFSDNGASVAVMIGSKDDTKASAVITKLRSTVGHGYVFVTSTYGGVDIVSVATSARANPSVVYAIVNHTVVLTGSTAYMNKLIDVSQGKRASLQGTADYTRVQSELPSDRLFALYVDVPRVVTVINDVARKSGASSAQLTSLVAQLAPYRGVGMTISAGSDGIALDATTDLDPGKLDAESRAALGIPAHENTTAADVPAERLGFGGITGAQNVLRGLVATASATGGNTKKILDDIHAADGIAHLTGDLGVEMGLGSSGSSPIGAVIAATDDEHAMRAFLDSALPQLAAQSRSGVSPTVTHDTYKGSDISVMQTNGSSVAWTTTKGVAVIGSSAAEVKAVIDTAGGGAALSADPRYRQFLGAAIKNNGELYIDVQRVIAAGEASMSARDRTNFERDVLPNLRPIQAVVLTGTNAGDHVLSHLLVAIG